MRVRGSGRVGGLPNTRRVSSDTSRSSTHPYAPCVVRAKSLKEAASARSAHARFSSRLRSERPCSQG